MSHLSLRLSHMIAPLALALLVSAVHAVYPVQPAPFTPSVPTLPGAPIGFAYAGNMFVGSILDTNNGVKVLYSTDLSGNYLGLFAPGVVLNPSFGQEHYVSSSLGLGGFPLHDIYVAEGANIHHISNAGVDLGLVVNGSGPPIIGDVRGITFDTTNNYGDNMIVTTHAGYVYTVNSAGFATQIAFTGEDTEGLDIAPTGPGAHWGTYDGFLFVASEGNAGTIRVIPPGNNPNSAGTTIASGVFSAEQLDFVPLNLGTGGGVEGMYSANYPLNVLKAPPSNFTGMLGDIIVTGEGNKFIYDVTALNTFTTVGMFPNQPEDGLFVTPNMINSPEPASLALLSAGGLLLLRRRRLS